MLSYHPALRFKEGEINAIAKLSPDIKQLIHPRFIIPSVKEFDHELGRAPTADEIAYLTGRRIGKCWPNGSAFLDCQHVADDLGGDALQRLLRTVIAQNDRIVSVVRLDDPHLSVIKESRSAKNPELALLLRYEEVDSDRVVEWLSRAAVSASDCTLFVDFAGAALDPEIASGSVSAILDAANDVARWRKIVFQASSFPAKNPADSGQSKLVPRHEWFVFREALKECNISPDRLAYGDYGADSGEIRFSKKKGGGRAIRHLRYTTSKDTMIVRADSGGSDLAAMQSVCRRIIESGHFAGRGFSAADDQIFRLSHGQVGPGNASKWREWNTLHHLMRVIRDLGAEAGIKIPADDPIDIEQLVLFSSDA